jgi:hypothetical protein
MLERLPAAAIVLAVSLMTIPAPGNAGDLVPAAIGISGPLTGGFDGNAGDGGGLLSFSTPALRAGWFGDAVEKGKDFFRGRHNGHRGKSHWKKDKDHGRGHDGDGGGHRVPEPSLAWLLGPGLAGIVLWRKKRGR